MSGLTVNYHEVEKVTKLVLALLICGEEPRHITVLSPYRAQVVGTIYQKRRRSYAL